MPAVSTMKPEPSEVVLCGCRSPPPPPGPPRWFLKKSSKNSSNGEPGGSFGIAPRLSAEGPPLASTVCEVEMLTTASITFSATSAMPSGPRANAGGASTRQLAPRQIAANQGRRQLERVERAPVFRSDAFSSRGPVPTPLENALVKAGIAAVILALSVFNERNGVAAQCAPERGCGASIDGSFHRHDRGQM